MYIADTLRCTQWHSFDIAREGYVNLLLSQKGRDSARGDSTMMVQARRAFLSEGHYAPLANAIARLAAANAPSADVILDCGCGEGYYLERLCALWHSTDIAAFGLDIARDAVRLAAKTHRTQGWIVADIQRRLPFADNAVSLLINVFAPRNAAEYARVLGPDGTLIVVIPMMRHLNELRAHAPLLGIEASKREHVIARFSPTLRLVTETTLTFGLDLDAGRAETLVRMTPSQRLLDEHGYERLRQLGDMRVTASFLVLLFAPT